MINIEVRALSGGRMRYRPNWKQDGRKMVETFDDPAQAQRFAQLVEAAGRRLPDPAVLRAMGFGEIADRHELVTVSSRSSVDAAAAPGSAPVLTVADWVDRYIDTLGANTGAGTIASYRRYAANYLPLAGLADIPVTRSTPDEEHLAKWRNAMSAQGGRNGGPLAGSTVKRVMAGILGPTFDMVARKGRRDPALNLPLDNPLDTVKAPRHYPAKQTRLVTDAQLATLYRAAASVGDDGLAGDAVLFMLATGLRWGETFGLTRAGVDPVAGTITVYTVARRSGGVWTLQEGPKTRAGWRTIHIPGEIAPMIAARYAAAADNPDGLLFPDGRGRVLQYGAWDDLWAAVLVEAARLGLRRHITAHGLRRTALTFLHLAGIPEQALTETAGHSDGRLTRDVYIDCDDTGRALVATAADGIIRLARAA